MKTIQSLLILLFLTNILVSQSDDYVYDINVKIEGLSNTECMLAYHLGAKQYVKDTILLNEFGSGSFVGTDSLPTGIYMIMIPALDQNYFEFVVKEQKFSLSSSSDNLSQNVSSEGSQENKLMILDQSVSQKASQLIQVEQDRHGLATTISEKRIIENRIDSLRNEVKAHRLQLVKDHPDLFYSKIVHALMDIELPETPIHADGSKDETFMIRYIQTHFFDHIDFSEDGLMRSPILERKVDEYLKYFTYQQPDSINKSIDFMLAKAQANDFVFKSLLIKFLNQFALSEIMGQDAVYVHLVDKYYATGMATWIDQAELIRIRQRSATIKPLLIGKTAPEINLKDHLGVFRSLHAVDADFTVVYFWNPDCGHCKTETPKLGEMYTKLSARGVEIYAANTDAENEKWLSFINDHQLNFINVADLEIRDTFREVYDVRTTPLIYVLDRNKQIIAKHISIEQIESIIDIYQSEIVDPK